MRKILLFSFLLHLITPYFSEGFLHFDEHYQILEFLGYKMGITPAEALPWEFGAKMRPWLWPSLYFEISKLAPLSPFSLALIFRYLSSLLGFLSLLLFTKVLEKNASDIWTKKFQLITLHLLWFIPLLHARISAETLGGTLLSIAVATYILKRESTPYYLVVGLVMGLASITRYHIGFLALVFAIWITLIARERGTRIFLYVIGGVSALALCTYIDYLNYKELVFAPFNYFYQNIINNRAADWGVAPWWDYFRLLTKKGPFFIAIPLMIAALHSWVVHRKNLFSWLTLSFFILHSSVGHKELRFLFPLVTFLPFLISDELMKTIPDRFKKKIYSVFITLNIPLMIYAAITPMHDVVGFFKNYNNHQSKNLTVVGDLDPFAIASVPMHFYIPTPPVRTKIEKSSLLSLDEQSVFVSRLDEIVLLKERNCALKFANYPEFVLESAKQFNLSKRMRLYALYLCPAISAR